MTPIVYTQWESYEAGAPTDLDPAGDGGLCAELDLAVVGSVTKAVRELNKRGILWARPTVVSQQSVSERLRVLPPELFRWVLLDVSSQMKANSKARQRPLNAVMARALAHFSVIWTSPRREG